MDLDDILGMANAFDVIGHALTGAGTHPYNIQQVLPALQGIDPGYTLSKPYDVEIWVVTSAVLLYKGNLRVRIDYSTLTEVDPITSPAPCLYSHP